MPCNPRALGWQPLDDHLLPPSQIEDSLDSGLITPWHTLVYGGVQSLLLEEFRSSLGPHLECLSPYFGLLFLDGYWQTFLLHLLDSFASYATAGGYVFFLFIEVLWHVYYCPPNRYGSGRISPSLSPLIDGKERDGTIIMRGSAEDVASLGGPT